MTVEVKKNNHPSIDDRSRYSMKDANFRMKNSKAFFCIFHVFYCWYYFSIIQSKNLERWFSQIKILNDVYMYLQRKAEKFKFSKNNSPNFLNLWELFVYVCSFTSEFFPQKFFIGGRGIFKFFEGGGRQQRKIFKFFKFSAAIFQVIVVILI